MATPKKDTEPATPAVVANVTEPAKPSRVYDPNKRVKVYDTKTGKLHPGTVPETWVDGRFPNLTETPSQRKKEGN